MYSRSALIEYLRAQRPVIAPSMLKCDFGNLQREAALLDEAGTAVLHLDVMDGHFVPNLSYGPMVIERLRPLTAAPFDAHLMVSDPARYLKQYLAAGCEAITFHIEAVPEPGALLQSIRAEDRVAGLALNPGTPFESVEPYLDACDLLLVMSVNPGFGGQSFIPEVLSKVARARQVREDLIISIDGGINTSTIAECAAAGVDLFVAGSAVFDASDYADALDDLRRRALQATGNLQGAQKHG